MGNLLQRFVKCSLLKLDNNPSYRHTLPILITCSAPVLNRGQCLKIYSPVWNLSLIHI